MYMEKCIKSFANNIESFDNLEQTIVIQAIAGLVNAFNLDVEGEDISELMDYADGEFNKLEFIAVRSAAASEGGSRRKSEDV